MSSGSVIMFASAVILGVGAGIAINNHTERAVNLAVEEATAKTIFAYPRDWTEVPFALKDGTPCILLKASHSRSDGITCNYNKTEEAETNE